jgi:glycosyltransferase involved in cell wall biosynthesis
MRILHLSSLYPPGVVGGAEKVVAMLAEGQAARGHTVGAAYLSREADPQTTRNQVLCFPQKDRNLVWIEDIPGSPRTMQAASKLWQAVNAHAAVDFAKVITRFAPDVVHTHSLVELPPMIWLAAKAAGVPLVHTLHDYDLLCSRASMFKHGRNCDVRHASCRLLSAWKRCFHANVDGVVAVSQAVMDKHLQYGLFASLPPDRRRVIWNGAAADPDEATELSTARAQRTGPIVFGFLGRLVPEKGLQVLIDACRLLAPGGWRLRVAGRAPIGSAPLHVAGLPVELLGFVEPRAFLQSVDVLVVPSVWVEPFGLSVAEAWAAGAPVIGARSGAVAELAGRLGEEWVVPPADPVALAERMARVLSAGRAGLPRPSAFTALLQDVCPERMTDRYLEFYQECLRTPGGWPRSDRGARMMECALQ